MDITVQGVLVVVAVFLGTKIWEILQCLSVGEKGTPPLQNEYILLAQL